MKGVFNYLKFTRLNPLTDDCRNWDDAYNLKMLVNPLHTFSICLQQKMPCQPAVHFMLQTNTKSVQKKLTSIFKLYAPLQYKQLGVKGFICTYKDKNVVIGGLVSLVHSVRCSMAPHSHLASLTHLSPEPSLCACTASPC